MPGRVPGSGLCPGGWGFLPWHQENINVKRRMMNRVPGSESDPSSPLKAYMISPNLKQGEQRVTHFCVPSNCTAQWMAWSSFSLHKRKIQNTSSVILCFTPKSSVFPNTPLVSLIPLPRFSSSFVSLLSPMHLQVTLKPFYCVTFGRVPRLLWVSVIMPVYD